jgi:hypothetical protein
VRARTADYSQCPLGASGAGTGGVQIALGEQEAVQVVKAGQQVSTQQVVSAALGSWSHKSVKDLGDFAKQTVFTWSFPPATSDLPVYKALRADLAASGDDTLKPENLKSSAMHSWIGLYAFLRAIRDNKTTDLSRAGITKLMKTAKNVPMLDMFGGESWTPNLDHPGIVKRAGMNHWATYKWDPNAKTAGFDGNFVQSHEFDFDKVLCGSPLGGPPPC